MGNRADELRRRMKKRKKERYKNKRNNFNAYHQEDDPISTYKTAYTTYESPPFENTRSPLWKREWLMLKFLISIILVLATAIVFKTPSSKFDQARAVVKKGMEKEFQFAMVADWYESQFGKPLALLPLKGVENKKPSEGGKMEYALPASGKILTPFTKDGRGILIETGNEASVEAMSGGLIVFAGKKDDIGNAVIVQHPDKTESWYGHLKTIEVKQYEKINTGDKVGTASNNEEGLSGTFYFAFKKDDHFIDPLQVIQFE